MAKRPQSSLSAREQKILIQAGLAYEAGDIYQAESLAGQILQRHPHQFDASYILAIVAVERENPKARQLALNLVPFLPQTAEHQFNMGVLFEKLRDFDSAATYYRCSLQLRSDHFETLMALGNCELALRHPDTAIELFETCRQLQPCDPRVWNNLGAAFNETSCLDKAEKAYLEGQRLDPTSSFIQTGLACVYGRMNRLDCAIPLLEEVIANNPGYETAHFNYSAFLLISGQFKKGWPEYEWRRKTPVWKEDMPAMSQPEWQGEALLNKTLLIVCEQGIGDTIQFIRFLPKLLAMGATVAIACEPILTPLLACLNLPVQLIDKKTQASNFKADFWLPLLSLALRLDIDLLNLDSSPYIRISDEKIRDASQKIHKHAPNATRKIGLIWAGNPRHSNDLNRSMHPGQFLPLVNLKETVFFSLQKNAPGPQAYPELKNLNIIDLAPYLETLLDTAAFIMCLDSVITIDSGIAHLSGALGVSTYVLLPAIGTDWRWLLNRSDTPWYPSIRLFRQTSPGNWVEPIQELLHFLQSPPSRNILILCENTEHLETQIGLTLLQSAVPEQFHLSLGQLNPWKLTDQGPFDLVILGVGTSFRPEVFTDQLFTLLDSIPQKIGLFGLEENLDELLLNRILVHLDFWFTRTSSDMKQAKSTPKAIFFGDWLLKIFALQTAQNPLELQAGDEIWDEEDAISKIQSHKKVKALSMSTFLCALHSAETLTFETDQNKTCQALIEDIFHITARQGDLIHLDQNRLIAYKNDRLTLFKTFQKLLLKLALQV